MPPSCPALDPAQAGAALREGAVLVYPTEAVWGVGCDPENVAALERLLAIKQRPAAKGMIVISDNLETLRPWLALDAVPADLRGAMLDSWPGPHTWAVPCSPLAPAAVRGEHATLAVRITEHPVAAAICRAFGRPLVSTSANLSGEPPAFQRAALDPALLARVDGWVEGETGGLAAPTPIRDALTGHTLRS